jgi:MFS family permease
MPPDALTQAQVVPTQPAQPRRRTPLFALYTSNTISAVGDVLMFIAVPWFVLQTTGSVVQTGVAAFFSTAAVAASALLGAPLVDRLGFRRASVVSDLASGASVALIPLFYETVGLPFWALLLLVFLAGLLTPPGATARAAMVPDLAELAQVRLERASAASDGATRLSRFIGAPLAGVLIAFIGPGNLLWIDAASFAVSALLIGRAVPALLPAMQPTQPAAEGETGPRRFLAGLREGFAFIRRDPVLFWPILVVLVTNLLDAGNSEVLLPVFVKDTYGTAIWLGAMVAATGGAAFLGTIAFGAIGHRLPRRLTLGVAFTIGGSFRPFVTVLFAAQPFILVALFAVCGFFIGAINPIFDTVAYERTPVALRARVFGVLTAGAMLGSPLGGLIAGGIVPAIGITLSLLLFGAVYFIATSSLLVNPALRGMDAPHLTSVDPAPAASDGA